MLATQMPDTQVEAKDVKQVKQKDLITCLLSGC